MEISVGAFSGVENAKMWGSSPEMPKTGSPLAKGELRAQQSAEKLGDIGRDRNTRGTGTHSTHQHGHGALGAGQYAEGALRT